MNYFLSTRHLSLPLSPASSCSLRYLWFCSLSHPPRLPIPVPMVAITPLTAKTPSPTTLPRKTLYPTARKPYPDPSQQPTPAPTAYKDAVKFKGTTLVPATAESGNKGIVAECMIFVDPALSLSGNVLPLALSELLLIDTKGLCSSTMISLVFAEHYELSMMLPN